MIVNASLQHVLSGILKNYPNENEIHFHYTQGMDRPSCQNGLIATDPPAQT
jgi:hypothetical protein